MTCVIALRHDNEIFLGSDSAGVSGLDLTVRADTKIFRKEEAIISFTSSFRMGQLLQYNFKMPKHEEGVSTIAYLNTDFIDAIRECFDDGGYLKRESDRESGGCFLIGYRDEIACVESDFQVGIPQDNYIAEGCGGQIARGSLYASLKSDPEMTGEEHIKLALHASEKFSAGVRRPFRILKLKQGE